MKTKSTSRRDTSRKDLRGFREAFAAEAMKGARTAARKTVLIAPLPLCLLGLMSSGLVTGGHGPGGVGFNTYGWCWWYTLLLPVAIALVTTNVANIDVRQKFHGVMSAPMRPAASEAGLQCRRACRSAW